MARKGQNISARDYDTVDLNLRALRVFLSVDEAGSMAAAALRLGVSKSMVSTTIAALEKTLSAHLVDRRAKPLRLTPAGLLFRDHARKILNAVSDARVALLSANLAGPSALRLGIIDDLDASLTPELIGHLKGLYPQCHFSASSGLSDDLTASFLGRDSDLVITAQPPQDPSSFDVYPLLREPFVIVCAKEMPEISVFPSDAEKHPFVRYSMNLHIGRLIEQHLSRLRLAPSGQYAFDASRSVFAMVEKTGGWAITTPLCVLDSARFLDRLDIRPLPTPGLSRRIYLAARKDELGGLPGKLAGLCRDILTARIIGPALEKAPWLTQTFQVLFEEG
ncbi:MAG: LysR family transcriptional regulator [Pseudomonadota bacterium]